MRYTAFIIGLLLIPGKNVSANGQSLVSRAWVVDNRLTVEFSQAVEATDAYGFRLVGGVARIEALLSRQNTKRLLFSLTDYVLPDDTFQLLYWSELGTLRQGEFLISDWVSPVVNRAARYGGTGTLYYVATTGRDTNPGINSLLPLRTIAQAQRLAQAGDYILLRRGDVFRNTALRVTKSGRAGQYLTFGAYGQGAQPIVVHAEADLVTIDDQHYVHIDNWHLQVQGDGEKGVYIMGDCQRPIISNCRVEGMGKPLYGINFGKNDGAGKKVVAPEILNNQVTGFMVNIISTGYPYDGTHEVEGGLIENNRSGETRAMKNGDGIDVQRGKFHGLVVRKNEVFGYYDDGIDLYGADNVIIEYNTVHNPQQPSDSGQGIKAGGLTRNEKIDGHQSTDIIIRYNTVHTLYNQMSNTGSQNGINTNDGASGEIYGNLVYNVQGYGIVVSGPIHQWRVHHNIVANAEKAALNVWTEGSRDNQVMIAHNILGGETSDIKITTRTTGKHIIGEGNQLFHQKTVGAYRSFSDRQADGSVIFYDPNRPDLGLKTAYHKYLSTSFPKKLKQE